MSLPPTDTINVQVGIAGLSDTANMKSPCLRKYEKGRQGEKSTISHYTGLGAKPLVSNKLIKHNLMTAFVANYRGGDNINRTRPRASQQAVLTDAT